MHPDDGGLAHRKLVQAFYLNGTLAIFATGEVPSTTFEATIERSLTDGDEPHFALLQRRLPGIGNRIATPFTVSRLFGLGIHPRSVRVSHADGHDVVAVEELHAPNHAVTKPQGEAPVPYVFPPSTTGNAGNARTAIGYSASFDLREALREAVAALAPAPDAYPDQLTSITVVEIGAEIGGVAGFNHLFVRVRRNPDPARG